MRIFRFWIGRRVQCAVTLTTTELNYPLRIIEFNNELRSECIAVPSPSATPTQSIVKQIYVSCDCDTVDMVVSYAFTVDIVHVGNVDDTMDVVQSVAVRVRSHSYAQQM